MTTLRDWGPADDRALDAWITRGDHDDDPPEDELLPDCQEGAEIGPDAAPCGACAACLRHAAELADEGESPEAGIYSDGFGPTDDT